MNFKRRTAVISLVVVTGMVASGCSSSGEPDSQAAVTVAAATDISEPVDVSSPSEVADPSALLVGFAKAWDDGDWETMAAIASPEVVAVAQEWRTDGGNAAEGMAAALDSCVESGSGCEFLYAPPEGFGLIFQLKYGPTDGELMVTELVFGGDAG